MKISIVIPVYNEEDYLPACLDAIAAQTVMPDEVIVVDNNSTDSSKQIASSYKFVKLVSESRQGIVFARNRGFDTARSEIIARIDADTVLPPDWIERIQKSLMSEADGSYAAVTGAPRFYDTIIGKFSDACQVAAYQRLQRLLTGTYVLWGANMAIRRDAWHQVRDVCSTRTDIDEDIDLSFCLRQHKLGIVFLPDLKVGASLLRGRTDIIYAARYMAGWPRDYWLHKMYVRALVIALLTVIGLVMYAPLSLVLSVLRD